MEMQRSVFYRWRHPTTPSLGLTMGLSRLQWLNPCDRTGWNPCRRTHILSLCRWYCPVLVSHTGWGCFSYGIRKPKILLHSSHRNLSNRNSSLYIGRELVIRTYFAGRGQHSPAGQRDPSSSESEGQIGVYLTSHLWFEQFCFESINKCNRMSPCVQKHQT